MLNFLIASIILQLSDGKCYIITFRWQILYYNFQIANVLLQLLDSSMDEGPVLLILL